MSVHVYPVDPMVAFYGAVTAIENGKVGEIEIEFRFSAPEYETTMSVAIRRELRPLVILDSANKEEE